MSIVAFCGLLFPHLRWRWRVLFAGQFLLINLGLLLTYTRAQWIASGIAILFALGAFMIVHRRRAFAFVIVAITVILVGAGIYGASNINLTQSSDANPLLVRLVSIFTPDQTLDTNSLQWRIFENDAAMQSVLKNPILGVGLGNEYRGVTLLRQREVLGDLRFTRFIHNAYLYIAVKLGIPALIVFGWMCLAFLINGWRSYRRMRPGIWQAVTLAMLAGFVGLLFWSNTQPNFMVGEGTLFIGVLMGLVAAGRQLGLAPEQAV
jgi:O-antigen ligase